MTSLNVAKLQAEVRRERAQRESLERELVQAEARIAELEVLLRAREQLAAGPDVTIHLDGEP